MPSQQSPCRAAVYLRISSDPEGRRLGVDRQEKDCRDLCADYGYAVTATYTDNDVSASSNGRNRDKPRPEFERMLADARAGRVDMIVAFSTSRLTRKPVEWERLIRLHEDSGVGFHLLKRGLLDLSKAVVKRDLRNDSAADAYYADEVSELVRTEAGHRARRGEWHGGQVPYGFVRVGPKGEPGKLEHEPERAEIVRSAARRILAGETLYSIVLDLNGRNIRTAPTTAAPEGARWHARTLKRILTSPYTVGVREYRGQQYDGQWEGILDRPTWERLRAVLNDESRATRQSWLPAHKYVLSGLLRCGHDGCGAKLVSNSSKNRVSFVCAPITNGCGKLRINVAAVEDFVVRQVLAVLDVPAVRQALTTREESGDDDGLRRAIREDQERLQRLEDDFYDDVIDRQTYLRQRDRIGDRLAAGLRELADLQRSTFLVDTNGKTLRQAWDENDLGWRRSLLQHMVDRIVILPHPRGVTATLTAKRGETDEQLAERRRLHLHELMRRRVIIEWKPEHVPAGMPDVDATAFDHLTEPESLALWVSRAHANMPTQVTDPTRVGDVAGMVRPSA